MKSWTWKPYLRRLVLPLGLAFGCYILADELVSRVQWLNHLELGVGAPALGSKTSADPRILLIQIEDETTEKLRLAEQRIPRTLHARLIKGLQAANAASLLVDIEFPVARPAEDAALKRELEAADRMGITLVRLFSLKDVRPNSELPGQSAISFHRSALEPLRNSRVTFAHAAPFSPGSQAWGAVMRLTDYTTRKPLLHASLAAVLALLRSEGTAASWNKEADTLSVGQFRWRVGNDCEVLAARMPLGGFKTIEYSQALQLLARPQEARKVFEDKLVILGDARTGVDTTITPWGQIPGVQFMASMTNTLLANPALVRTQARRGLNLVWGFAITGLLTIGILNLSPWLAAVWALLCLSAASFGPLAAAASGIWLESVAPLTSLALALPLAFFAAFLSKDWEAYETRLEGTVLAIDLRDSTGLVRTLGAERYGSILKRVQQAILNSVTKAGGEKERFTGDGLMALFPSRGEGSHAQSACKAFKRAQLAVAEVSREEGVPLEVTGGMESGVIDRRITRTARGRESTAVGQTVVLAARLQSECGESDSLLVGPTARELLGDSEDLELRSETLLKGFAAPVRAFRLKNGAR